MDHFKELIKNKLDEYEAKSYVGFSDAFLKKDGKTYECYFYITDEDVNVSKCYIYFDNDDSDDYIINTLRENLVQTLVAIPYVFNFNDENAQALLNGLTRSIPLKQSTSVSDTLANANNFNRACYDLAYMVSGELTRDKSPLPNDKITEPSHKMFPHIVGVLFTRWCKRAWADNHVEYPMLDYPERACLSLNTVNKFAFDEDLLEDTDHYNDDLMKLQDKIMKGLGVKDK